MTAIHAHIKGGVETEAEAASVRLELDGRVTQIGQRPVDTVYPAFIKGLTKCSVVAVHQLQPIEPRRQPLPRQRQHLRVSIEAEDPCGAGLEERLRVTSGADGAINHERTSGRRQLLDGLPRQHRLV